MGQGLAVALAVAVLAGHPRLEPALLVIGLVLAEALLLVALGASFLHLGYKLRAWRAVLMWRTSWMSREVIAMPAMIAALAAWIVLAGRDPGSATTAGWMPVLVVLLSAV